MADHCNAKQAHICGLFGLLTASCFGAEQVLGQLGGVQADSLALSAELKCRWSAALQHGGKQLLLLPEPWGLMHSVIGTHAALVGHHGPLSATAALLGSFAAWQLLHRPSASSALPLLLNARHSPCSMICPVPLEVPEEQHCVRPDPEATCAVACADIDSRVACRCARSSTVCAQTWRPPSLESCWHRCSTPAKW